MLLLVAIGVPGAVPAAAPAPAPKCPITAAGFADPSYAPNAPLRSHVGNGFVLTGVVRSGIDCAVIPRARVEFWLRGPTGEYDDVHRGTVLSDSNGRYRIESNFPGGSLPDTSFAQPHIHVRVAVPGFKPLVTAVFPKPGTTAGTFDLVLEPEL